MHDCRQQLSCLRRCGGEPRERTRLDMNPDPPDRLPLGGGGRQVMVSPPGGGDFKGGGAFKEGGDFKEGSGKVCGSAHLGSTERTGSHLGNSAQTANWHAQYFFGCLIKERRGLGRLS